MKKNDAIASILVERKCLLANMTAAKERLESVGNGVKHFVRHIEMPLFYLFLGDGEAQVATLLKAREIIIDYQI